MKAPRGWSGFLPAVAVALAACNEPAGELFRAPPIPNLVGGVVFEAGNWAPHLAAGDSGSSWGNHRAVVEVEDATVERVLVTIPWRRHDRNPASKSIVVVDAATNQVVRNAYAVRVENASGDVIFQPNAGSGLYHVYYLPWHSTGGYYPTITYPERAYAGDPAFRQRVESAPPRARVRAIQSVDAFHSFFPMELIATRGETAAFMAGARNDWRLVPEYRDRPVRMRHFIPRHWTDGQVNTGELSSPVLRGEAFTFQVAVISGPDSLSDLQVSFEGIPDGWRPACFNCGGVNEKGEVFRNTVSVPAETVRPLWIGVEVPEDQEPGLFAANVIVTSAARGRQAVTVSFDVQAAIATNHGFDEPELMTRLVWLNSTAGTDPDFVIEPFHPVQVEDRSLSVLGRRVQLGPSGLPERILSFFSPELTHLVADPEPVLARPVRLDIMVDGRAEPLVSSGLAIEQEARGRARWSASSTSDRVELAVEGVLEYDGMLDYRLTVRARTDVTIQDIVLPVSMEPAAATYMLGLGYPGGRRPAAVDWKWKIENHQEGVWLGGVNKGLQYVLRDDGYVRPLNTNFYQNQPLRMPQSWFNEGRGGIRFEESAEAVTAVNYSGPRRMAAGEALQFNVRFLITPFKTIDTGEHFRTRFVHRYVPVDSVRAWGGTVVNIHHANEINPFINYPFFNLDRQTDYIREAHRQGIKVKLYNTIRELTYKAHELFALRSLGDEILNDGEGGGHSWMQEHLEDGYHSAWHAWRVDDAAMLNKGTSRWTNYYIEGLNWLAANQQIDGLYLDDIAFSRETVKRMISVLHEHRDEVVIDLHSANQFNPRDGHINSAMLYMEHFPFVSRLWFGEYFDYGQGPDYWMTEVAGLPFGLMGEMLQDGGHPYRGLLYGMTARMYGDVDPRPVWEMMNTFGIDESRMLGYWLDDTPATVSHPAVLATSYVRGNRSLIALASWADEDVVVTVDVSDTITGGGGIHAFVPGVDGLQSAAEVDLSAVPVPAGRGLFLIVERR